LKKRYFLLIFLITICVVQLLYKNKQLEKVEEEINNQSDNIENCIDFENKNKRTIYENIKLSEYCIDNFGTMKSFK
tara:strand:- start:52 stop:279 length:228 start_codon:yes stop_codon:yes gene_type:complete